VVVRGVGWEGRSQWVKVTYLFPFYGKLKIQLPILGRPPLCAKDGKINVQRFHIPNSFYNGFSPIASPPPIIK
jgi:hypothetical protein